MRFTQLPGGDLQLGDYPFRLDGGVMTIVYYLTERCNFRCRFCTGWNEGGNDCLTDKFEVSHIADRFRELRDKAGMELYILLTGGEPSLVSNFCDLAKAFTKHSYIELQTNLCTKYIREFANTIDPSRVGEIMATYHSETVEKNPELERMYFSNFELLYSRGFSVVFKIIAMPKEVSSLVRKIEALRRRLPDNTPLLIQPFISGVIGPREHPTSFPYLYSNEDKQLLSKIINVRRSEILDYIDGAGWFHGMQCDAGRGFIAVNKAGFAYRCVADMVSGNNCLGDLMNGSIRLLGRSKKCYRAYCWAPFWGLWYGVNPWKYFGMPKGKRQYSRFSQGPAGLPIISNNDGIGAKTLLCHEDEGKAIRSDEKAISKSNSRTYAKWACRALEQGDYPIARRYALMAWRIAPMNWRLGKTYLAAAIPHWKKSR